MTLFNRLCMGLIAFMCFYFGAQLSRVGAHLGAFVFYTLSIFALLTIRHLKGEKE